MKKILLDAETLISAIVPVTAVWLEDQIHNNKKLAIATLDSTTSKMELCYITTITSGTKTINKLLRYPSFQSLSVVVNYRSYNVKLIIKKILKHLFHSYDLFLFNV